jgi:hypothetical protein
MTTFNLKAALLKDGYMASEDNDDVFFRPNGISIKFYWTSDGVHMFNVVDLNKPKYKWMHFRFRVDRITCFDDFMYLMQGSTVRGY